MVHALEICHRLLTPNGILVDIHPAGEPPALTVRDRGRETPAGWVEEADEGVAYEQADRAIAAAVARGWFELETQGTFLYTTHADSLEELQEHLEEEWSDARIDPRTAAHIEELMAGASRGRELIVRESVKIARLRRLEPHGGGG